MRRIALLTLLVGSLFASAVGVAVARPPDHAAKPDKPSHAVEHGPSTDRGPSPKVDICHRSGEEEFHLINVSGNALEAHLAHGDVLPGDAVADLENQEYGPDCDVRSTQVVEASFDDSEVEIGFAAYRDSDDAVSGVATYSDDADSVTVTIIDVCLDEIGDAASVWGLAVSTLNGDGFMVVTLVYGEGSLSARALWFDDESAAVTAFASQCASPDTDISGGTGSLTFF